MKFMLLIYHDEATGMPDGIREAEIYGEYRELFRSSNPRNLPGGRRVTAD